MNMVLEWFSEQQNFITLIQILLDIALIIFLMVYFLRRPANSKSVAPELVQSLERVIAETKGIAEAFDSNLQERQALIRQILTKLDQKLKESEKLCLRLEDLQQSAGASSTHHPSPSRHPQYHEILRLAKKGLDAAAIAKRLQKPLGEVELILNLERISPAR